MGNEILKPCPFCEGTPYVGEIDGTFYVTCSGCFVEKYPHTILDSYGTTNRWTKEEAIKAWNTRPTPPKQELVANKEHFEQNMLDGDKVEDCGRAMLEASHVWEYIAERFGTQNSMDEGKVVNVLQAMLSPNYMPGHTNTGHSFTTRELAKAIVKADGEGRLR